MDVLRVWRQVPERRYKHLTNENMRKAIEFHEKILVCDTIISAIEHGTLLSISQVKCDFMRSEVNEAVNKKREQLKDEFERL